MNKVLIYEGSLVVLLIVLSCNLPGAIPEPISPTEPPAPIQPVTRHLTAIRSS